MHLRWLCADSEGRAQLPRMLLDLIQHRLDEGLRDRAEHARAENG